MRINVINCHAVSGQQYTFHPLLVLSKFLFLHDSYYKYSRRYKNNSFCHIILTPLSFFVVKFDKKTNYHIV